MNTLFPDNMIGVMRGMTEKGEKHSDKSMVPQEQSHLDVDHVSFEVSFATCDPVFLFSVWSLTGFAYHNRSI